MTPDVPITDKVLLRPEEAAALLATSRSEVYRLIAAGRLRSVLLGHRRRIPRAAVDALVSELVAEAEQWHEHSRLVLRRVRA
jgi:excisionase family DNA binding protein